jgi:quinolinate synthase
MRLHDQVMEYVAAGDVAAEGTHFLSTEGMMRHARESGRDTMIVATETGILHRMEQESPDKRFIPANRAAVCNFMKMITLPKLRDSLRDMRHEVSVPQAVAARARVPIERMVAIG